MVSAIGTPLGDRVRRLREARDWSQKELAAAAHVPREWLSTVETGTVASPSGRRLEQLAAALGVTSRYLVTGEQGAPVVPVPVEAGAVGDVSEFAAWPAWARRVALAAGRAARALSPIEHVPNPEPEERGQDKPQDD